jgi:hypothetical protein
MVISCGWAQRETVVQSPARFLYEIALVVRATDVAAMRTFGFMLFTLLI